MLNAKHIRRIDDETIRTHAWTVHVERRTVHYHRYFSDNVYGGREQALKAAQAYRDEVLASQSGPDHQMWIRTRLRKNNTSSIPGVGRYESLDKRKANCKRIFWMASWMENGKSRKKKFSVLRYGEQKARQMAIDERERQLRRVCACFNPQPSSPP
jgi:hypothetical protein